MKLYTYPAAPNPRRLQLFMQVKGIELEVEPVDLMQGEQFSESFQAINPRCTVPVLVLDDDTVLTEVIAICQYLESVYPQKPLMGVTPLERALVSNWDHRIFLEGLMAVAEIFRNGNKNFKDKALPGAVEVAQISALVERGQKMLALFWSMLDGVLSKSDYVAGNTLTLADIDAVAVIGFAGWVHIKPPAECLHLQGWYARMQKELSLDS